MICVGSISAGSALPSCKSGPRSQLCGQIIWQWHRSGTHSCDSGRSRNQLIGKGARLICAERCCQRASRPGRRSDQFAPDRSRAAVIGEANCTRTRCLRARPDARSLRRSVPLSSTPKLEEIRGLLTLNRENSRPAAPYVWKGADHSDAAPAVASPGIRVGGMSGDAVDELMVSNILRTLVATTGSQIRVSRMVWSFGLSDPFLQSVRMVAPTHRSCWLVDPLVRRHLELNRGRPVDVPNIPVVRSPLIRSCERERYLQVRLFGVPVDCVSEFDAFPASPDERRIVWTNSRPTG